MQRRYHPGTETWYNYYYVQDGLGHTRLLLDGAGNVKNRYAYDAWGNLIDYEENVPNPFFNLKASQTQQILHQYQLDSDVIPPPFRQRTVNECPRGVGGRLAAQDFLYLLIL
jgi:hypothetical protein